MTYDADIIANNILQRAFRDKVKVTPMQLQKLIYITHCLYARYTGRDMITSQFQAWQYGPVQVSLYEQFSHYGGNPITHYATRSKSAKVIAENTDPELNKALNTAWDYLKLIRPAVLVATLQNSPAWVKAWDSHELPMDRELVRSDKSFNNLLALSDRG